MAGFSGRLEGRCEGVVSAGSALGIAPVSPDGEKEEESAQQVLALGDPGDGLDVERVPAKQGGHTEATPEGAREPVEDEEEQQGVDEVEEQIREVMPDRIEPEELNIEHVGKPGEGMPVGSITAGEGPGDICPTQTGQHVRVLRHVFRVVEIGEGGMGKRPKQAEDDGCQQGAGENQVPGLVGTVNQVSPFWPIGDQKANQDAERRSQPPTKPEILTWQSQNQDRTDRPNPKPETRIRERTTAGARQEVDARKLKPFCMQFRRDETKFGSDC